MKYRKITTVEATQWWKLGDHPAVIPIASTSVRDLNRGWCPTREGVMFVEPGDWILTGIQGEHWPCKSDIFAETYIRAGDEPPCLKCGGPHPFDTSVPSVVWNEVIRAAGHPDYLCATCILEIFAYAKKSFTAVLSSEILHMVPVEIRIDSRSTRDAQRVQEENTTLREKLRVLLHACEEGL